MPRSSQIYYGYTRPNNNHCENFQQTYLRAQPCFIPKVAQRRPHFYFRGTAGLCFSRLCKSLEMETLAVRRDQRGYSLGEGEGGAQAGDWAWGQTRQETSPTGQNYGSLPSFSMREEMVPLNLRSYFFVNSLASSTRCCPENAVSNSSSLFLSLRALMKLIENSSIFMLRSYWLFSQKLPVARLENPSNLPLSLSPLAASAACSTMMPALLGPPTTSTGTSGMVFLTLSTSLHPGSEMQGIPASLTSATVLVSSRALTRSNMRVSEQVLRGMSTPLPLFLRQFMICVSMCFRSVKSIPQSSSNLSPSSLGPFPSPSTFNARYLRYSNLNAAPSCSPKLWINFLLSFYPMFEQLQNRCFSASSFPLPSSTLTSAVRPISPKRVFISASMLRLRMRLQSCPATLRSSQAMRSAVRSARSMWGEMSSMLPMGVGMTESLPLGGRGLTTFWQLQRQVCRMF